MQEINLEYYYKLHIFFIRQATGGNNLFVNFACKILKFLQSLFGKHLLNIILKNFCLVVLELAREKCFCFAQIECCYSWHFCLIVNLKSKHFFRSPKERKKEVWIELTQGMAVSWYYFLKKVSLAYWMIPY